MPDFGPATSVGATDCLDMHGGPGTLPFLEEAMNFIGQWVIRRKDLGTFLTSGERGKAHLVESEITDRLVMNCGRQLKLVTSRGQFGEFVARRLETRCQQCI